MQRSALCRYRRELSNEYLLAKIGVDTAENETLEVWGENYSILFNRVLNGPVTPVREMLFFGAIFCFFSFSQNDDPGRAAAL